MPKNLASVGRRSSGSGERHERAGRRHPGPPHPDRQHRRDRGRARPRRPASGPGGHRCWSAAPGAWARRTSKPSAAGAAGRGRAHRRAPGRRGDRRWHGLGSHAARSEARPRLGGRFPLIGVAAEGRSSSREGGRGVLPTRPNWSRTTRCSSSYPVSNGGTRRRGSMDVAGVVAGGRPSVTVLINGGQIAYTDVDEKPRPRSAGGGARRKRSYRRRHRPSASWERRRRPRRRDRGVATDESGRIGEAGAVAARDRGGPRRRLARISPPAVVTWPHLKLM